MKTRTSLAACLLVPALLTGCADGERDDEAAGGSAPSAPGGEGDDRPDDVSEWSSEQLADLYNTAFSNLAAARSVVLKGEVERDGAAQSVLMELEPERDRCTISSVAGEARHRVVVLTDQQGGRTEAWRRANAAFYRADGELTDTERSQAGAWVKMLDKTASTMTCTQVGKDPNPDVQVEVEGEEMLDGVATVRVSSDEFSAVWIADHASRPRVVGYDNPAGTITFSRFDEELGVEPPADFIDAQAQLDQINRALGKVDETLDKLDKVKEQLEKR